MSKDITMTTGNGGRTEEMHIIEDHEFREVFEISDFNTTEEKGTFMSFYVGRVGVAFGLEKTKLIRDYLTKIIERQESLLSINNEQEVPNEPSNGCDLEEEEEDRDDALKASVEQIILGYLPFGVKVPLAALSNMSKDIHGKYQEMLQEASTLSREQIIKIIRGTKYTKEQLELSIIKKITTEVWDGKTSEFLPYLYTDYMSSLPDDELYAIFSIIRDNPV